MEAVADDFDVAGGAERFAQQAVRFVVSPRVMGGEGPAIADWAL